MKTIILISLLLSLQNKTVPLKGVVIVTAPGIPSAPVKMGIR